jgi:hypothetical protein
VNLLTLTGQWPEEENMKTAPIKNPVKELEQIEKSQRDLRDKLTSLSNRKEEVGKAIVKSPWRMTEITPKLKEMRKKAMRIPEIRLLLARYKLSIEDAAFITFWRERVEGCDGRGYLFDCMNETKRLKDPILNHWEVSERYLYGGPQDAVKIIFDESKNSTSCIYGFMAKSPVRLRRERRAA